MAGYRVVLFDSGSGQESKVSDQLQELGHEVQLVGREQGNGWDQLGRYEAEVVVFTDHWPGRPPVQQNPTQQLPALLCLSTRCESNLRGLRGVPGSGCAVWPCSQAQLALAVQSAVLRRRQLRAPMDDRGRRILDALPIGILGVGPDLRVEMANPQARRTLSRSGGELLGQCIDSILSVRPVEADLASSRQHLVAQAIRSGRTLQREVFLRIQGRGEQRVWLQVTPLQTGRQGAEGAVVILLDGLASDYGQLGHSAQAYHMVGQMATGIAHHYNNLLTIIQGYSRLVRQDLGEDHDDLVAGVDRVIEAAERAAKLTHQLLDFSRNRVGQPVRVDVHASLRETVEMLRPMLPAQIGLDVRLQAEQSDCQADPGHLREIWANLLFNARDAIPGVGTIGVTTRTVPDPAGTEPQGWLEVLIRDTGQGMDESTLRRAFDPFFTTRPIGQGVGLGLSTVYYHVQQVCGQIEMDSRPGKGTTVRLLLPLLTDAAPGAAEKADEPAANGTAQGSRRIAVVDDEPAIQRLARSLLVREGYEVECFGRAGQALERIRAAPDDWDMVILDVVMPEMSGIDLLEQIRRVRPDLPAILTSGCDADQIAGQVEAFEDVEVLAKPWQPGRLGQVVAGRLG